VIRNAGGVVSDDALRSLIVSHWLLGTEHAYVIGHLDCGMAKIGDEELRTKLSAETGADTSGVDFLTFSDVDQAVKDSVARIRTSELLSDDFTATGYVYDVTTGLLRSVS